MASHGRQDNRRGRRPRSSYDELEDVERPSRARDRRPGRRRGILEAVGGAFSDANPRLAGVFAVLVALAAIVVLRLAWLQVIAGPGLAEQAEQTRSNEITLTAKRGTIYDRNGNVLAMSVDATTIYANPQVVEDDDQAASILSDVLGGDRQDYLDILDQDTSFAYVQRKVDTSVADDLRQRLDDAGIDGIYYLEDSKRVYPYGGVAGQVLGLVGTDGQGLTGLELYYNDELSGTDGTMIMEQGADGTPIAGGAAQVTKPVQGSDIVVSLDINLQAKLEDIISQAMDTYTADSASAMVTDPRTGEILATCSTPLADISDPSSVSNEALNLRMVSDSYEPGSIFKIITMTAGLNAGTFDPTTVFNVPAQIKVGDDMVSDAIKRYGSEDMTVTHILEESSNVGAILMARSVGAEQFSSTVASLGIGSRTGIDFPGEGVGMVTDYDNYSSMTLSTMAFGQGLAIPQVQMVQAVGALANGGTLYTPHFLVEKDGQAVPWDAKGSVCTPEVSQEVSQVLESVVENGTATHAAVDGYAVAAKTGTAQMTSDQAGYAEGKYISSLIGYANADDPRVLVYVGLNGTPHLAESSSAYLFSSIMGEALSDMDVAPES